MQTRGNYNNCLRFTEIISSRILMEIMITRFVDLVRMSWYMFVFGGSFIFKCIII